MAILEPIYSATWAWHMDEPGPGDTEFARGKAQWRVGIAGLRKLRRMVDSYEADERFNRTAARYVLAGLLLALLLALVLAWSSPGTIRNLLRSLS